LIFTFKIFDIHEVQYFEDAELKVRPLGEIEWKRFDFLINTKEVQIMGFRSYVLFEGDNPTNCTKVFLSDGTFVYACLNFDTFKKKYEDEYGI